MTRLVAIVVAVAMLASVARAAGTANVSLSVIPNPLAVSLALDLPEAGVGEPRVATATVQNLGAAGLSGVTLSLRVDPIGVALRGGPSAPLFISGHSSVTAPWNICGSSPGSYLLIASATVGAFRAESAAQLFQVNSGGGQCEEAASGTVSPGDSFSTDAEGDGAHPGDVVETGVTSPAGGLVEIVEQQGGAAPPGLTVLGWQVVIVAPPTTATHPLRIEVELDASLLPPGVDALTIEIFRNGVPLPLCGGPEATPDPCRSGHALQPDGDLVLMALTSAASTWTFGTTYRFTGFFSPVDNPPTINTGRAGRAIPVKFSLGGAFGLYVLASGYPKSQRVVCDTGAPADEIEETVGAGASSLTYDAASGNYSYTWKTLSSWAGTCRQLVVRLADGTEHVASFKLR